MADPIPGLISGVAVLVGKAFSVGVADAGNQIMVGVGGGVSEGMGVSVGGMDVDGRQAPRTIVIARSGSDEAIFQLSRGLLRRKKCPPRNDG